MKFSPLHWERIEHLTSLRVKSVLGEGSARRIIGWVLTQQKHFGNFLSRQEIVLGEVLTNCAQTLDPHQEIQVLAALKPNFYPLPIERGKWYMELSRLSTLYIVKMGIPLSKGEGSTWRV